MKSSDLTVIYLTCNKMPPAWVEFHREHLLRATEGRPMICVSAETMTPSSLGRPDTTYVKQDPPFGPWNVYRQILRAAKLAKTEFVAVAEDDTLYPARHFSDFRPKDDEIAYDMSRWSLFSWQPDPFFSAIRRHGNFTMIGPRELVIESLEERERKHPNAKGSDYAGEIGRPDVERNLRVTRRKLVEWYCIEPMVNLCHPQGLSPTYIGVRGLSRKPGELKAYDIPVWGKAAEIAAIYNEGTSREDSGVS